MPKAVVLTKYGPPDVLVWKDVAMPEPGPRQVRIRLKCAGVSPTDPKIRRGDVQAVFRLPADAVLGFEAAGVVDALGSSVEAVKNGDEVACLLPDLGGYAEYALASSWTRKPPDVSWSDAAALPSSAEAAVGVLKQLGLTGGETLLILGAGGSVGMIALSLPSPAAQRLSAPQRHETTSWCATSVPIPSATDRGWLIGCARPSRRSTLCSTRRER
jgi:NADPH:quinone reductase-like Zn-dependent oxidoreductase